MAFSMSRRPYIMGGQEGMAWMEPERKYKIGR
jgi:hypothetical protein